MSDLQTFAPVRAMYICHGRTGSYVKLEDYAKLESDLATQKAESWKIRAWDMCADAAKVGESIPRGAFLVRPANLTEAERAIGRMLKG